LAGALLFDEKIIPLFWFVQIFFSQAVIQRTIVDFLAFLETGLAQKISVCVHTNRMTNKKDD
jgi:hypothetical protein